ESIRIFNPDSQLSVENKKSFSLVPNVQTRLLQEMRESLLKFLPADTAIWVKDLRQTLDIIGESFEKVSQSFADVVKSNGGNKLITDPAELFEKPEFFEKHLKDFSVLEFGKQYYLSKSEEIVFKAKPQPSFNKEFKLLVEDLNENQTAGFVNFIAAESHKQIERISAIVEELDPIVKFQALNISLREGFWDENLKLACYTDHQVFDRFHSFRSKEKYSKSKAITLRELRALHPGDFVTHADHGIARFAGLEKLEVNNRQQEA